MHIVDWGQVSWFWWFVGMYLVRFFLPPTTWRDVGLFIFLTFVNCFVY